MRQFKVIYLENINKERGKEIAIQKIVPEVFALSQN